MASPETVRVSHGAAMMLKFKPGKFYRDAEVGCVNLLMERVDGCRANCAYCGQARDVTWAPEKKSLIRVDWPSFPLDKIIPAINSAQAKNAFVQRACIASLAGPDQAEGLLKILEELTTRSNVKVSCLLTPTSFRKEHFVRMAALGADNITIALDAATPELFDKVRGKANKSPNRWDRYITGIQEAVEAMGTSRMNAVGVHLIIGLGETEEEAARCMQMINDMGANVHLFAFNPEDGTGMADHPQAPIRQYRHAQIVRHLLYNRMTRIEGMRFDAAGIITDFGVAPEAVALIVEEGEAFRTSGCSGCNRPFSNETPSQGARDEFLNYPVKPDQRDITIISGQLAEFLPPKQGGCCSDGSDLHFNLVPTDGEGTPGSE